MNEYFTLCNTRRAHVNEFFTLAQQILQVAKEMLAETEAQPRIATYESAVTAFDESLKQSTKNSYTASVELADEAVDETWSALWGMTKVMVKHPNLDRRAAAALVYDIMYKYGNVTKLSYKEEYGRLHNLTQDLDNLGEEKLKLAYVDEWFAELKKRIATYKTAARRGGRPSGRRRQSGTRGDRERVAPVPPPGRGLDPPQRRERLSGVCRARQHALLGNANSAQIAPDTSRQQDGRGWESGSQPATPRSGS